MTNQAIVSSDLDQMQLDSHVDWLRKLLATVAVVRVEAMAEDCEYQQYSEVGQ